MSESACELIGSSDVIARLRQEVVVAARSSAKVVITGESGAGKELVARAAHSSSARRLRPLKAVHCAGVPDTLLESELFGHLRGSFTGAVRDHQGLFEAAHGGAVVLDEIGDSSARMQALLLRFLQFGELQRVGDSGPRYVDVRVFATTRRDLRELIVEGEFRLDLYYRLHVIGIRVPPMADELHLAGQRARAAQSRRAICDQTRSRRRGSRVARWDVGSPACTPGDDGLPGVIRP